MTNWDNYVGQASVKAKLEPYIAKARATAEPLPHIFLESEPGCGKTSLANLIAEEVGDPLTVVDISKMTEKQLVSFVRRSEGGIFFWDECHTATPKQQSMMLQLMEEGFITTSYGGQIFCEFLTVIAATTDPQKMSPAILSRFAVRLRLDPYSDEDMAQIIQVMAKKNDLELPEEMAMQLGMAAAGNPRKARDLVTAYEALTFTDRSDLEKVLEITDTAPDGLTKRHLEYLGALSKLEGLAGERPLCNVLRWHSSQLQSVERVLFDRGYVTMTPQGRALLAAGDRRLNGPKTNVRRRIA